MASSLEPAFLKCLFTILLLACIKGFSSEEDVGTSFHYGPDLNDLNFPVLQLTNQHVELERYRRQADPSPTPASNTSSQTTNAPQTPTPTPVPPNPSNTGGNTQTAAPTTRPPTLRPATLGATTAAPLSPTPRPTTRSPQTTLTPMTTVMPRSTLPTVVTHDRKYYTMKTIQRMYFSYWEDLNIKGTVHKTLSEGHRLAQTVKLKFAFSFYGHIVRNVTIATGGFLYMSPFLHKFLTATQYIAPLMANFDTTVGNESNIRYLSTSEILVVQWENVHLKDQVESGRFNFQVQLKRTGEIYFLYKDVPVDVSKILEENHPVKVGLSDAFYSDKDDKKLGMKRRTIYEYHRVTVNTTQVTNQTAVILEPKPTCNMASTCDSCLSLDKKLDCAWCGIVNRCSDGVDWYRQHWLDQGCNYLSGKENCSTIPNVSPTKPGPMKRDDLNCTGANCTHIQDKHPLVNVTPLNCNTTGSNCTLRHQDVHPNAAPIKNKKAGHKDGFPPGAVIAIILIVALVVGIGGWFFYAYKHPTTSSGIWLMEHRPTAMKTKLAKMKFWKQSTPSGDKYAVESEA